MSIYRVMINYNPIFEKEKEESSKLCLRICVKLPLLPLSQGRAAAQYAQRGQAEAEGDAFFPGCGQISRS